MKKLVFLALLTLSFNTFAKGFTELNKGVVNWTIIRDKIIIDVSLWHSETTVHDLSFKEVINIELALSQTPYGWRGEVSREFSKGQDALAIVRAHVLEKMKSFIDIPYPYDVLSSEVQLSETKCSRGGIFKTKKLCSAAFQSTLEIGMIN